MLAEPRLRVALAALALVGLAIAIYLTAVHYQGDDPVCLAGSESCSRVQESEYAELASVPVPLIGVVGYVTILLAAALPGDPGRLFGVFAGLIGFGFSAYLSYLELFVIDAICQWCVASAVVMTLVLIVATARAIRFLGLDDGTPTKLEAS